MASRPNRGDACPSGQSSRCAADSDATVLILGETGTGKELVARALHEHGSRKTKPFVAINCAAIPADLLESELFGHVKGSFTDATADRVGAFREAADGTLFLDEIGDMPAAMQGKILRAIEERVVTSVGGKPYRFDARLIAATHRDLPNLVANGAFREDLYYRLNVVPILLPSLREHREDILPLAEHFLRCEVRQGAPKRLSASASALLLEHSWPGNVRELRNVIARACVLVRGDTIDATDLDIAQPGKQIPSRDELLTPVGDIEGIILTNGFEIHVPPHLTEQVAAAVRSGELVAVRGWSTGVPNFIVTTSLTGQRGQSVVDHGPPPSGMRPPPPPPGQAAPGAQMATVQGRDFAGSARTARGCEWSHSRRRDNSKITAAFGVAVRVLIATGPVGGCAGLDPVKQLRSRG